MKHDDEMRKRDKVETVKADTRDRLDRMASHAKEMGHTVKADIDKSKRDVRDKAARERDREGGI